MSLGGMAPWSHLDLLQLIGEKSQSACKKDARHVLMRCRLINTSAAARRRHVRV